MTTDPLVMSGAVAALLNIKPRTLRDWRDRGLGPAPIVLSRKCIRYRLEDVMQFIESRKLDTTQSTYSGE